MFVTMQILFPSGVTPVQVYQKGWVPDVHRFDTTVDKRVLLILQSREEDIPRRMQDIEEANALLIRWAMVEPTQGGFQVYRYTDRGHKELGPVFIHPQAAQDHCDDLNEPKRHL
jgi:hypothetical protein